MLQNFPIDAQRVYGGRWHLRNQYALESYLSGLREEQNEWLLVFYLSAGHKLLCVEAITQHCPTRVEWDFRHLLRRALLIGADATIMAHNHPSGIVTASRNDMMNTAQFARISQELGIPLLAHYIVTKNETGLCGYW